ncbi:MAG: transcription-repair coupling factor [Caldilineaceae bacterium]
MNLSGLLDILPAVPAFRDLVAQITAHRSGTPTPLEAQALLTAARPFVVAGLKKQLPGPLVLLTSRSEMAQQLVDQLLDWLPPQDEGGPPVLQFADPDALPYERISWSSTTRQRRLTALSALQSKIGPAPVVVASARSLLQKTLPARELRLALRPLKVGGVIRLEQMALNWVLTGYHSVDVVEEPGSFARRGGIIDIWPPNLPRPVRIDLFGDEIESLRLFDPTTQRSEGRVSSIEIGPGSEALSKYGPMALERLGIKGGALADPENVNSQEELSILLDSSLLLAVREEIRNEVEQLGRSESFHGIEWYLPYFYDDPSTLLDHLPAESTLVIDDALDLFATIHEQEQQAQALKYELEHSGELPHGFASSFVSADELRSKLQILNPIVLGLGDLNGRATQANTPLARSFAPGPRYGGKNKEYVAAIGRLHDEKQTVTLITRHAPRLKEELMTADLITHVQAEISEPPILGTISLVQGVVSEGFVIKGLEMGSTPHPPTAPSPQLHLYSDSELYGWSKPQARRRVQPHSRVAPELFFADVKKGDFVVHIEHGIGLFDGLVRLTLGGVEREYLQVSYAREDKLYVPVHQADRLSRYVGAGEKVPAVSRLGTADWNIAKERVKQAIADIAEDLLKLYAERELAQRHIYSPDTEWQQAMEAAFPYEETDDQLRAIDAVKRDMESDKPMDRLVMGDVGYGKTEVAVRAAFKAINDQKQVALLAPTTVLAQQHFRNISRRFDNFPVRVDVLSRFRTPAQQQKTINDLRTGQVDMVVGTHRLLSEDVVFKDLGLLIIDEEQRFGVEQKEKLKQLRTHVDVLTLSATPIPRTLHMSLSGLRDMSTLTQAPRDRQPIHTVLAEYDDTLIKQAIQRELTRKGQVFVVNDRVRGIQALADKIQHLVPEARVVVGHGQMNEHELEATMIAFADGEADVLVATTIIENGLDIPNANTIIINRADHFGLAQLYQLRGRVGRSTQRGHCYLLYDRHSVLSFDARRRLNAIMESSEELGAGYRIAMRDLEIRGAGELLGARQHGNIDTIGFDLYTRLIAQTINELRRKKVKFDKAAVELDKETGRQEDGETVGEAALDGDSEAALQSEIRTPSGHPPQSAIESDLPFDIEDPLTPPVQLDLPIDARIPQTYVEEDALRLQLYRRIAGITHIEQIDEMRQELVDRFGEDEETKSVPIEIENLFYQIRVKMLAIRAGIERIGRELDQLVLKSDALENMDRPQMQRRLRLGLRQIMAGNERAIPDDAARVGRRAIYLPLDEEGKWKTVLLRTLEIMAYS